MKSLIVALAAVLSTTFCFGKTPVGNPDVVAATLILEAGGERDPRAMAAVAEVIFNRAKAKTRTAEQICLARLQFSCWNGIPVSQGISKAQKHPKWSKALQLAKGVTTSYTNGADHYHTPQVSPKWAKKLKKTAVIGNHIFYR
jgi:spore germination cell wall hydrolase CwlJ-like protein